MERVIMWIMAAGAVVGGMDRIFGNRLKLGERFEQGLLLLGPTALSMVGILCLAPLLSGVLERCVAPVCRALGMDPGIFGGILAIDMGGYQLARDLSLDARVGRYAGILVASTLGCTVSFTIPVGMGMLEKGHRPDFAKGVLFGLIAMPPALLLGGLMMGLNLAETCLNSLPVLVLSGLLLLCILKFTDAAIRGFGVFARIIQILTTLGLVLGAVQYMTGLALLPGLTPIEDGMAVAASIGIVMLGSLPVAELLRRCLEKPLGWVARHTGMNSASVTGLLVGMVSVVPAIVLVRDMDRRGRVVNAAFLVCGASGLAAHLGFTAGVEGNMILPMLASKLLGGLLGTALALLGTRGMYAADEAGNAA